ncbi:MAG: hypothetical protein QXH42_09775 [Thermoplasmata archaeon]
MVDCIKCNDRPAKNGPFCDVCARAAYQYLGKHIVPEDISINQRRLKK